MDDIQEGQTATNPKTGQKVVYQGGQWVNAGGAGGPGAPKEQARYNTIQDAGDNSRAMMRHLLTARQLVEQQPTGVIPGAIQGIKRALGDDGMETQARENLDALNNRLVMSYRVPGAGSISDSERASLRGALPQPGYQRGSNEAIISRSMGDEWTNLAKAKLAAKWRQSVGSLDAKSPNGTTFDEAYSNMLRSPSYQQGIKAARNQLLPGAPVVAPPPAAPAPLDTSGFTVIK
jgi:hypothetical protein